ncbi:RNA polymerase II transcription initiation/nucleotide excision repair factor TFIIH subunit SSL1 [Encephalitozoon intestinalis ATCC 50506]|uniref:RNA polymerase II transcription initiation/nucleotide excision repair factor TFIIH subunit SSL1 n=1 Tax=Encephalitozoon intestinalis (strain ATCC 50506) TaxID=876142 RepID=E0S6H8_ENCIT|nr:RNA polymerase II transcription initiation/nucleotide excision repair factor TFIIH subunit SSL1 [Encephalitozoon intestinalis ATCC 50506]ADM11313.1 RNA polymerase II transcription initiation/nucleotide excision repair factor TFIIH subunit SSL1 [Encephalitozoon intestinalis ATCC 50506]UTX44999.1 RNA polymerase II transcription initiation/nucleotide excision repair factor TFIIH subunit SSL1 [Encephalitozoon intestinalis]
MAKQFSWEQEYKRTWEDRSDRKVNEFNTETGIFYSNNRKGIVRHLHVIIDVSEAIDKSDFLPTFRTNVAKILEGFIPSFYSENPLSTLSFLSVRDVCVKYISSMDMDIHAFLGQTGSKWFSLLNGLEGSVEIIKNTTHVKEILVIVASTSTRDPHGYTEVLTKLKVHNIKVHFISLCGEVTLYKSISKATEGRFYVPVDVGHLSIIMKELSHPTDFNGTTLSLVKIGFPLPVIEPSVCACHLEMKSAGYECPVCKTMVCSLPVSCPICNTQLVSTLNLSKSLRFLYPLKPFIEKEGKMCRICQSKGGYQCELCKSIFCNSCNGFVHNTLSFCIYCELPYN